MTKNITFVRTQYQDELKKVHSRLMEGKQQVADVKNKHDRIGLLFVEMPVGGERQLVRVMQVGANSFGLEVKVRHNGNWEWTALEQFGKQEQLTIALAIDWTTLQ